MAVVVPPPGNAGEHLAAKLLQSSCIWEMTVVEFANQEHTELYHEVWGFVFYPPFFNQL